MSAELPWSQEDAVALCRRVEAVCAPLKWHVALTGGCLYKDGPRKDADLLFYRVREETSLNVQPLFTALKQIGFTIQEPKGRADGQQHWVTKATFEGAPVDLFFPDFMGSYP